MVDKPWFDNWWVWVIVVPLLFAAWNVATTGDVDGRPGVTCHTTEKQGAIMDEWCYDDATGEEVVP